MTYKVLIVDDEKIYVWVLQITAHGQNMALAR